MAMNDKNRIMRLKQILLNLLSNACNTGYSVLPVARPAAAGARPRALSSLSLPTPMPNSPKSIFAKAASCAESTWGLVLPPSYPLSLESFWPATPKSRVGPARCDIP
jgi:hypothetical protein